MTDVLKSFASELQKLGSAFLINAGMNSFGAVSAISEGKEKIQEAYKIPSSGQVPLGHWSEYGFNRGKVYKPSNKLFRARLPI